MSSELGRVYFCEVDPDGPRSDTEWRVAASRVLEATGALDGLRGAEMTAIKLHVGEPGVSTFLPPSVAAGLVEVVKRHGGRPFLTDSAVLYNSRRNNGAEHTEVAIEHGFTLADTGAAFIPADGLNGAWEQQVAIDGKHFERVGVSAVIAEADFMVLLSHATGHLAAGLGAALKNLGMGCSSRKGKLLQHSDTKPFVRASKCVSCRACIEACPVQAISEDRDGKAVIDEPTCIGCGECIAHCRVYAVGFRWDSAADELQEKMVEHALGVVQALQRRVVCVTGLVNITEDCDCIAPGSKVVAKHVGFLASTDPVAIDQAVMDLLEQREGQRLDQMTHPSIDADVQLSYGERLGLGSRRYTLKVV